MDCSQCEHRDFMTRTRQAGLYTKYFHTPSRRQDGQKTGIALVIPWRGSGLIGRLVNPPLKHCSIRKKKSGVYLDKELIAWSLFQACPYIGCDL